MTNFAQYFVVALVIYLLFDLIWLGLLAKNFYKNQLGNLMNDKPNWLVTGLFYLVYAMGLTFFVIQPSIVNANNVPTVILSGVIFGLVTYAAYDLTNLATLKNLSYVLSVVDLIWGAIITASTAILTYIIFI